MKKFISSVLILCACVLGAHVALAAPNPIVLSSVVVSAQNGQLVSGVAATSTYDVTITTTGNGSADATLSILSGLPAGVIPSFNPTTVTGLNGGHPTGTSVLSLHTTNATPAGVYNFVVKALSGAMTATTTGVLTIGTPDLTAPVISEVTAVVTPTNDNTPNYKFTTNEAGTITYGGACSSVTTTASVGTNTITLNTLADGTYSNCTITVTDNAPAHNVSSILTLTPFVIDTIPPVITINPYTTDFTNQDVMVTASTSEGTLNHESHTFISNGDYTFVATDDAGNESSQTVSISNIDKDAPDLSLPSNITAEATSAEGAEVDFVVTATDRSPESPEVSCDHVSGELYPLGETVVSCSATDAVGNSAEDTFIITVEDTTAPEVEMISNIEIGGDATSTVVTYDLPTSHDIVDGEVGVTCTPESGSVFNLGTTEVNCSATDTAGNTGTASFQVIVSDTGAPTMTLPGDRTVEATDASGAMVEFSVSALDGVDGEVQVSCDHTSGETFPFGDTLVTCTASDHAEPVNIASGTFTITVEDTTVPVVTLSSDEVVNLTVGDSYEDAGATAEDNIDGDITEGIDVDGLPINTEEPDTYTITYQVTDSHGNTSLPVTRTIHVSALPPTTGTLIVRKNVIGADGETDVKDDTVFTIVFGGETTREISESNDAVFYELEPGTHSLSELPHEGYSFVSMTPSDFSIVAGTTTTVLITNRQNSETTGTTTATSTDTTHHKPSRHRQTGSVAGSVLGLAFDNQGTVLGEAICPAEITSYMKMGGNNNADEVKKLQAFLNTEINAELPVTGVFGKLTLEAVKKFQEKYSEQVMMPWVKAGLLESAAPTGLVYKTTLWWINAILCGTTATAVTPILP